MHARLLALLLGVAATNAATHLSAEQSQAQSQAQAGVEKPRLHCPAGPAERYFAGVQWYIFACDDGESIVVVTGPKSPKDLSFYFIIYPKDGAYTLHGEGNGDKALTRPAYEALTAMSDDDFRALHAEATDAMPAVAP